MMQKQAVEGWLPFPARIRVDFDGCMPKDGVPAMQVMEPSKEASRMSPVLSATGTLRIIGWIVVVPIIRSASTFEIIAATDR